MVWHGRRNAGESDGRPEELSPWPNTPVVVYSRGPAPFLNIFKDMFQKPRSDCCDRNRAQLNGIDLLQPSSSMMLHRPA